MKRVMIFNVVFLMTATLLLAGQPNERERKEIGQYLQLNTGQQAAWDSGQADFRTATTPLFERFHQLGRDTEAALKSQSADACTIGNMMIASQAIANQIKAQKETLEQKRESVLTPEQKTKYDAFRAARPEVFERRKLSQE